MTRRFPILALALLCAAAPAAAQGFEITPFYGYTLGNDIDASGAIDSVGAEDATSYGLAFGYFFNENAGVEFHWNRFASELEVNPSGASSFVAGDLDVDTYHVMGNWRFGHPSQKVRGFLIVGLGITDISPDVKGADSESEWSFTFGGGAQIGFTENLGLRLQYRWTPTYVSSEPALYCTYYGYCYAVEDAEYLYQNEFSAGLTIAF